MTIYIALLHSIVLGAGRRVVMADLRATAERIGFRSPRTLVATGNLVFEADTENVADVEKALEQAFAADFGKHVDIIARNAGEWRRLAAGNPFPDAGVVEAANIVVRVMRTPLSMDVLPDLQRRCRDGEKIHIVNGDLWIHFPGKPSTSKLLSALTSRRLGPGTLRNWNTVRGLTAMIEA
ncbi:hypothetical protein ADU59_08750 [Pararhizobium polonicum]|uniref:DUF1697 domain-containing protein n=1 Tax=Pararhizobium polonicum TaxID=1612624 RepID=A0A1C7P579_9HYPH|nr:DUF1697 domain-containing protein [Pararhizobium polonicum]OBZ96409.1 hypothetical protein ADU59_08750 [Pararhizobium polonicum]